MKAVIELTKPVPVDFLVALESKRKLTMPGECLMKNETIEFWQDSLWSLGSPPSLPHGQLPSLT
jgi:hypothetical protein